MKKHFIHSLFYNVEQTARIIRAGIDKYFEKHSDGQVSFDEFIILDTVYCFPQICQRDLAKLTLKGTSHTSKFLAVMEEKGLIERPVDKKGNRIVRKIIITPKGMEVYIISSKLALEYANKIESSIGQQEALDCISFMNKIKETICGSSEIIFE